MIIPQKHLFLSSQPFKLLPTYLGASGCDQIGHSLERWGMQVAHNVCAMPSGWASTTKDLKL